MKPESRPPAEPDRWEDAPLEWTRAAGHSDALLAAVAYRQQRRRRRLLGGAAVVLAFVCLGLFTASPFVPASSSPRAAPRTVVLVPEQRTLPDGTVVELRPGAELIINFAADSVGQRRVRLTRGEALFHVAKNPTRPFVVSAGTSDFRAIGTAFSVNLMPKSVALLVTEGRVTFEPTIPIDPATTLSAPAPIIEAGFRVTVAHAAATPPTVASVTDDEVQHALAWRVPRIEFSATPLAEVVRLLNVHSGSRLRLATPGLGQVEISGALRANNLDPLFQILRTTYRIDAVRSPEGVIVLSSAR
jgi:transmembrane sensor